MREVTCIVEGARVVSIQERGHSQPSEGQEEVPMPSELIGHAKWCLKFDREVTALVGAELEAAERRIEAAGKAYEAEQYLTATRHFVDRKIEIGTDIPADVAVKRRAAHEVVELAYGR